jgi:cyanophycinase
MLNRHLICWLAILGSMPLASAQDSLTKRQDTPPSRWIDPRGIYGSLIIVGGGNMPQEVIDLFRQKAGGENAKLVVIPTAKEDADDPNFIHSLKIAWQMRNMPSPVVLHTRQRQQANDPDFIKPLLQATAVWIDGGVQERLSDAYADTLVERAIKNVLRRGGVVGGTSAGAAIQSKTMIVEGRQKAKMGRGFDLLPGCIVDQHFTERKRIDRLSDAINQNPHLFGAGIDESTALVVEGRSMRVVGRSNVTICQAPSATQDSIRILLSANDPPRDLPNLRREARERVVSSNVQNRPIVPNVDCGSLMLVGGGVMTSDLASQFVQLAGGIHSPIVVLPTSPDESEPEVCEFLTAAGAKDVIVLAQDKWQDENDETLLSTLRNAKGIWFDGERPWHFCEAYEDSPVLGVLRDCLDEGGVIGGTSAGASLLGEFLVRGELLETEVSPTNGIKAGFGLLPGATVDRRLLHRDAFSELENLAKYLPMCWGIGLDESTAVIVRGTKAKIAGKNEVRIYRPKSDESPDPIVLTDGEVFDFERHEKIDIADFDVREFVR